jgi:hypothetical protein
VAGSVDTEQSLRPGLGARRSVLRAIGARPVATMLRAADPAPEVRIAAAHLAAPSNEEEVKRALEALLRDPDPEVRDAVRRGKLTLIG